MKASIARTGLSFSIQSARFPEAASPSAEGIVSGRRSPRMLYFAQRRSRTDAGHEGRGMTNTRKILIVGDDSELREALVEQLALLEEFESVASTPAIFPTGRRLRRANTKSCLKYMTTGSEVCGHP